MLPLFATKVAAGFPSPADDHVEKQLDVGLLSGDKVVVDRSKTPGVGDSSVLLMLMETRFLAEKAGFEPAV